MDTGVTTRSRTDVVFFILFFAFMIGWGTVGFFAFTLGDPQRLIHPTDSRGGTCGVNKPYLFYFDVARCGDSSIFGTGCPTPQVCVKSCPSDTFDALIISNELGEQLTKKKLVCKDYVRVDELTVDELIDQDVCARYYMESNPINNRCIPFFKEWHLNASEEAVLNGTMALARLVDARQTMGNLFHNYSKICWGILIGLAASLMLSILWLNLLRLSTSFTVWITIIVIFALQGFAFWICFTRFTELKDLHSQSNYQTLEKVSSIMNLGSYLELTQTWVAFLIILGSSMVIILLSLILFRNRIPSAIALISHASKVVANRKGTLWFPIIPWVCQVLVIGFFGAVAIYAASIGKSTFKVVGPGNVLVTNCSCTSVIDLKGTCVPLGFDQLCSSQCPGTICNFFEIDESHYIIAVLQAYNLFCFFWSLNFLSGFAEMVLAGAFVKWYWALNEPRDIPKHPLQSSFFTTIIYNLGTVAIGSLVIPLTRPIRVFVELIETNMLQKTDDCCSWCCKCTLVLERFFKYFNRKAYIICARSGTNFRLSASEAVSLSLNPVRGPELDKATEFIMFLGRLVIVIIVGTASVGVFTTRIIPINNYLPPMNCGVLVILSIILGSYVTSGLFFGFLTMAIDTIVLSFLKDQMINDGSEDKPYCAAEPLRELLTNGNVKWSCPFHYLCSLDTYFL